MLQAITGARRIQAVRLTRTRRAWRQVVAAAAVVVAAMTTAALIVGVAAIGYAALVAWLSLG